jgi:hypothetical protein
MYYPIPADAFRKEVQLTSSGRIQQRRSVAHGHRFAVPKGEMADVPDYSPDEQKYLPHGKVRKKQSRDLWAGKEPHRHETSFDVW